MTALLSQYWGQFVRGQFVAVNCRGPHFLDTHNAREPTVRRLTLALIAM